MKITQTLLNKYRKIKKSLRMANYRRNGSVPWSTGYIDQRVAFVKDTLNNPALMQKFIESEQLPTGHGARLDERVVEYPWTLARIPDGAGCILDAGSTLNFDFLAAHPRLREKNLVIYTLAPEGVLNLPNVSYLYGDLRDTILKDAVFDGVVCISTLEHVGMNNTLLYTADTRFQETDTRAYRTVVAELRRLLKPGGKLLLTVPYGRYENHGWLQQFDAERITDVIAVFGGARTNVTYYRYLPDGWRLAEAEDCADCRYFNIHATQAPAADYAAAARAVACIEMIR